MEKGTGTATFFFFLVFSLFFVHLLFCHTEGQSLTDQLTGAIYVSPPENTLLLKKLLYKLLTDCIVLQK